MPHAVTSYVFLSSKNNFITNTEPQLEYSLLIVSCEVMQSKRIIISTQNIIIKRMNSFHHKITEYPWILSCKILMPRKHLILFVFCHLYRPFVISTEKEKSHVLGTRRFLTSVRNDIIFASAINMPYSNLRLTLNICFYKARSFKYHSITKFGKNTPFINRISYD